MPQRRRLRRLACLDAALRSCDAPRIRIVLDNLSTHSAGALYQAFPACEARRVLRRLEFHYVPKHASWLNMVEIEIGVQPGDAVGSIPATIRHTRHPTSVRLQSAAA
jgi:hypothetical protein